MWYDRYAEDDLDNHHPTCKGGCGELADECMCNFDYKTGTWKKHVQCLHNWNYGYGCRYCLGCGAVDTAPVDNVGWTSDHWM